MDGYEYDRTLKRAILAALGIAEPRYHLKVDSDTGGVAIILRDAAAKSPLDPGDGVFIHSIQLSHDEGVGDHEIPATAQRVADEIRPHLAAYEKNKTTR